MVDQEHSLEHFSGRTGRGLVRLERQDGPRCPGGALPRCRRSGHARATELGIGLFNRLRCNRRALKAFREPGTVEGLRKQWNSGPEESAGPWESGTTYLKRGHFRPYCPNSP